MTGMKKHAALLLCLLTLFFALCGGAAAASLPDGPTVSYLGPAGTYTEEATQLFFPDGVLRPKTTVFEAIADVVNGVSDYAVIPQENTLGGVVADYADALIAEKNVYVVGEIILPISQTLMALPGASLADIRTVCSHAQGIVQSAEWRKAHLPDAAVQEMTSTAAAASFVAQAGDRTIAAVAAPGAAKLYGLEVLAENVQLTDTNRTRFYVLSTSAHQGEQNTRALFLAVCEAGRIDDIIVEIHFSGLELAALHDRPEGSRLGMYNYLIEVFSEDGDAVSIPDALSKIPELSFLGTFNVLEK